MDEDFSPDTRLHASPAEAYLAKEQRDRIVDLIQTVKGDQGTALYLTLVENLSNEEAASVMKKSKKQIANLLFQGRRKIRTLIEKEGILT